MGWGWVRPSNMICSWREKPCEVICPPWVIEGTFNVLIELFTLLKTFILFLLYVGWWTRAKGICYWQHKSYLACWWGFLYTALIAFTSPKDSLHLCQTLKDYRFCFCTVILFICLFCIFEVFGFLPNLLCQILCASCMRFDVDVDGMLSCLVFKFVRSLPSFFNKFMYHTHKEELS